MRIIAGLAKGRKLLSPEGMGTRPTLDRIKQSIFNIIQLRVAEATVLDMFAGTGSLGLESVSRGAKKCYLIDKGETTFPILKKNVDNLKFNDICTCLNADAYMALNDFSKNGVIFDIIFIDPPYLKDMIPKAIDIIAEKNLLHKEGIIVTKIDTKEVIFEGNEAIVLTDKRVYGNTTVCFYQHKEE